MNADKERILMFLVRNLMEIDYLGKKKDGSRVVVDHAVVGDLVICSTSGMFNQHPWVVGWVVSIQDQNAMTLRELGSDRLCNIGNDSFYVVRGVPKDMLLEGAEREFCRKVVKAFVRGDEYTYRYGGVDIEGRQATIWIREVFGGGKSKPFVCTLTWNKRTSIKSILAEMRAAGYGSRNFEQVA